MPITALPLEILLQVTAFLDKKSLLDLRLVSHSIHAPVTSIALRHISVPFHSLSASIYCPFIEGIHTSNLENNARYLCARMGYAMVTPNDAWFADVLETISLMTRLTSFSLLAGDGPKHWWNSTFSPKPQSPLQAKHDLLIKAVLHATSTGIPRDRIIDDDIGLTELILELVPGSRTLPNVSGFDKLKKLHVLRDLNTCPCGIRVIPSVAQPAPRIGQDISQIIEENPGLEYLAILNGCSHYTIPFNDILPLNSSATTSSGLLNQLTTLILRGVAMVPSSNGDNSLLPLTAVAQLRHVEVYSRQDHSPYTRLWNSLKAAKTELEILVTHQIDTSLINYLSSFSGLRVLEVYDLSASHDTDSSDIVRHFRDIVLRRHSTTLQTLILEPSGVVPVLDNWSFTRAGWGPALSRLTALETLCVPPKLDDVFSAASRPSDEFVPAIATLFSGMVEMVEDYPTLKTLEIHWYDQGYQDQWWMSKV
ncbi:hypothetical protein BDN72DRAFT_963433, partial [Pluteus cervinus]